MESLLWHVTNRTAETLLILNLFHLLLAGLTLLVLFHQRAHRGITGRPDRLLTIGSALLASHFALLTFRCGVAFFLHEQLRLVGLERVSHGLLVAGIFLIVSAYLDVSGHTLLRFLAPALAVVAGLSAVDLLSKAPTFPTPLRPHSWEMLTGDVLAIAALALAIRGVVRGECNSEGRRFRLLALGSMTSVFVLHVLPAVVPAGYGVLLWNLQEHLMSLALSALTWAVGERSQNLLDRVFVRLNLTFLILASLIMMITAGMEKYQYFRLAEERSTNLAEFLRGHYIYYSGRGENLHQIFDHPEVLRRVVAEFGSLPELREIDVYAAGQRAQFRYMPDFEVKESIEADDARAAPPATEFRNSFPMIRLPINTNNADERIEFIGTLDYVNAYIGKYLVFIYCSFTLMLGLGTVIIGMIVADTDRQLRRQYADLQEAQQQLAQSAKLASIGELAGGMAHEINNPITSILALASHMAGGETANALPARSRKNLQVIARQAERVASLVSGLLTFSRQTQLHLSKVDVAQVLASAIELVGFRLERGGISMHSDVDATLPPVQADASRLTEVFVNLLSNAIDATPSGGTITVRALRADDDNVRIEVKDTGRGISAEHLPRIFDPFFTTKAPGRGTGLGLSISHGIIKDHGGEIWAQSEPGKGTTLVVELPVGAMHYEPACSGN